MKNIPHFWDVFAEASAEALLASGATYEVYQSHSQRLKQILQRESRVGTLLSKQEDLLNQTIISFLHSH